MKATKTIWTVMLALATATAAEARTVKVIHHRPAPQVIVEHPRVAPCHTPPPRVEVVYVTPPPRVEVVHYAPPPREVVIERHYYEPEPPREVVIERHYHHHDDGEVDEAMAAGCLGGVFGMLLGLAMVN